MQGGIRRRLPQRWFNLSGDRSSQSGQLAPLQARHAIGKRFIAETPFERLQHFPRYLKAVAMRLDKLRANPSRDAQLMAEYAPLWTNYERRAIVLAKQGVTNPQVEQFRWLLEELRVQLFAQELRTPAPVSVKRLQKMWEAI